MKTPRLLNDLYGDLRDRRLLPVAIVLVVATLAVPFLLSSDDPVMPPAPADPAAATDEMPTMPAVLASNPSLRDYRERLDSLREKNPFADDSPAAAAAATAESAGEVAAGDEVETAASAGGASGSATFSETFSEAVTETSSGGGSAAPVPDDVTIEVDESGEGSSSGSGGDGGGGNGGNGGGSEPPEGGQWYSYAVDVTTGLAGDLRERKNLQGLTVLPSRSNPVAVYIGVGDGGKEAVFMVSPDVVDSRGDGDCLPSPSSCQYLTLRKNDERRFEYAPSGEPDTYVLVVDDISLEPLKDPPDASRDALHGAGGASVDAFLGS
jgi:hypothetical protein